MVGSKSIQGSKWGHLILKRARRFLIFELLKCGHMTFQTIAYPREICAFISHQDHYSNTIRHYNDVIMSAMASQITSLTIAYSTVYSVADQIKHQSYASLAFVRGIHRWPVNSPHKGPVTRKMFPFDDVIMNWAIWTYSPGLHHAIYWRYPLAPVSVMDVVFSTRTSAAIKMMQMGLPVS